MATVQELRERTYLTPTQCVRVHGGVADWYRDLFRNQRVSGQRRNNRIWINAASLQAYFDSKDQSVVSTPNVRKAAAKAREYMRQKFADMDGVDNHASSVPHA